MNIELKPCPFCGGEARIMRGGAEGWYGCCPRCFTINGLEDSYHFNGIHKYFDDAVKAWNTRAERTCRIVYEGVLGHTEPLINVYRCLECDGQFLSWPFRPARYCPFCGAKVVEE